MTACPRLLAALVLGFSALVLGGCSTSWRYLWLDANRGFTSDAMTLAVGECREVRLAQSWSTPGLADPTDHYATGVRVASIEDPNVATLESTGRTWRASEKLEDGYIVEDNLATIFRVCGVAVGTTSILIDSDPDEPLGKIRVDVVPPVAP